MPIHCSISVGQGDPPKLSAYWKAIPNDPIAGRVIRETYDAIAIWVSRAGRRLARVNWEIYGDPTDDPAKLETKIYMLVEPEAAL